MELGREITAEDVVLDTRYAYPEYGLPNDGTSKPSASAPARKAC